MLVGLRLFFSSTCHAQSENLNRFCLLPIFVRRSYLQSSLLRYDYANLIYNYQVIDLSWVMKRAFVYVSTKISDITYPRKYTRGDGCMFVVESITHESSNKIPFKVHDGHRPIPWSSVHLLRILGWELIPVHDFIYCLERFDSKWAFYCDLQIIIYYCMVIGLIGNYLSQQPSLHLANTKSLLNSDI
jgi:hypothetical protein